jgi:hypothetical protein
MLFLFFCFYDHRLQGFAENFHQIRVKSSSGAAPQFVNRFLG